MCVTRGWAGRDNAILPEPAPASNLLENAATPTRRVHAVLAGVVWTNHCSAKKAHLILLFAKGKTIWEFPIQDLVATFPILDTRRDVLM